jgi:hypothetical protein
MISLKYWRFPDVDFFINVMFNFVFETIYVLLLKDELMGRNDFQIYCGLNGVKKKGYETEEKEEIKLHLIKFGFLGVVLK